MGLGASGMGVGAVVGRGVGVGTGMVEGVGRVGAGVWVVQPIRQIRFSKPHKELRLIPYGILT